MCWTKAGDAELLFYRRREAMEMKIMSLNVNRFSGMKQPGYTDAMNELTQCPKAEEIIGAIKRHMGSDTGNIVVLQEIPYMRRPVSAEAVRRLYGRFERELSDSGYEIFPPLGNGLTCTLAIAGKNSGWRSAACDFGRNYRNKYVAIEHPALGLSVLGVHAPVENRYNRPEDVGAFFEGMYQYARRNRGKRLVILGDMNVHSAKACSYFTIFDAIRKSREHGGLGYTDQVKDGQRTYFRGGTTIDHVLASPALSPDGVTAQVVPQEKLPLSDHAVIFADIQEECP